MKVHGADRGARAGAGCVEGEARAEKPQEGPQRSRVS